MTTHHSITLRSRPKGMHLITDEVLEALPELPQSGLLHVFIQHTSAGLAINENADPTVRKDIDRAFDVLAPENQPFYQHTMEGPDDMPAHIKSVLAGSYLSVPIVNRRLALGTWQGIYLCEFRREGGPRKLVLSLLS